MGQIAHKRRIITWREWDTARVAGSAGCRCDNDAQARHVGNMLADDGFVDTSGASDLGPGTTLTTRFNVVTIKQ